MTGWEAGSDREHSGHPDPDSLSRGGVRRLGTAIPTALWGNRETNHL